MKAESGPKSRRASKRRRSPSRTRSGRERVGTGQETSDEERGTVIHDNPPSSSKNSCDSRPISQSRQIDVEYQRRTPSTRESEPGPSSSAVKFVRRISSKPSDNSSKVVQTQITSIAGKIGAKCNSTSRGNQAYAPIHHPNSPSVPIPGEKIHSRTDTQSFNDDAVAEKNNGSAGGGIIDLTAHAITENNYAPKEQMNMVMGYLQKQSLILERIEKRLDVMEKQSFLSKQQSARQDGKQSSEQQSTQSSAATRQYVQVYKAVMDEKLPLLDTIFDNESLCRSTAKSILIFIAKKAQSAMKANAGVLMLGEFQKMMAVLMQTVKNPKAKACITFDDKVLKESSDLAEKIISDAVCHAHLNTWNHFTDDPSSTGRTPQRPFWLCGKRVQNGDTYYYISVKDVQRSLSNHEDKGSNKERYRRKVRIAQGKLQPEHEDYSDYIASHLSQAIGKFQNSSRRVAIFMFLESLWYVMYPWSDEKIIKANISKKTLEMQWKTDALTKPLPLSNIPLCTVCTDSTADAIERNSQVFEEFVRSRTELQIIVTHDVSVITGKTAVRKRDGKKVRKWRRTISLLDSAMSFLLGLSGFNHQKELLLSCSKNSIISIYSLAVKLREVLEIQSEVNIMSAVGSQMERRTPSDREKEIVEWFSNTFEANSQQLGRILSRRLISITPEEYDANHMEEAEICRRNEGVSITCLTEGSVLDEDDEIDFGSSDRNDYTDSNASLSTARASRIAEIQPTGAAAYRNTDEEDAMDRDAIGKGSELRPKFEKRKKARKDGVYEYSTDEDEMEYVEEQSVNEE